MFYNDYELIKLVHFIFWKISVFQNLSFAKAECRGICLIQLIEQFYFFSFGYRIFFRKTSETMVGRTQNFF